MSQQPDSSPRITRRLETQPVEPATTPGDGSTGQQETPMPDDGGLIGQIAEWYDEDNARMAQQSRDRSIGMSTEPDWLLVRRVDDESGSHVEPALDEDWPDLWKLRWHAAVVASVIGLRVQVDDADVKLNGVPLAGRYNIRCGSSTASVGSYRDAWTQLNGIETGAQQALAAGWHPPARVITSAEELDALPICAVVRTAGHSVAEKRDEATGPDHHGWLSEWQEIEEGGHTGTADLDLPVTVLYTPTEIGDTE